jgi:hypothetical protein
MNLGQLIDAERVQRGFGQERPRAKAACEARGAIEHSADGFERRIVTRRDLAAQAEKDLRDYLETAQVEKDLGKHLEQPAAEKVRVVSGATLVQTARAHTIGGRPMRVLQALAQAARPLSMPEVRAAVGEKPSMGGLAKLLNQLHARMEVTKAGVRRRFTYEVTALGRSRLRSP